LGPFIEMNSIKPSERPRKMLAATLDMCAWKSTSKEREKGRPPRSLTARIAKSDLAIVRSYHKEEKRIQSSMLMLSLPKERIELFRSELPGAASSRSGTRKSFRQIGRLIPWRALSPKENLPISPTKCRAATPPLCVAERGSVSSDRAADSVEGAFSQGKSSDFPYQMPRGGAASLRSGTRKRFVGSSGCFRGRRFFPRKIFRFPLRSATRRRCLCA
jgi:hypothetical protein